MIHIVGAGPGDPELITVKGARYLAEADVVIYAGSLVNPALLDMCKEGAEIHNSAHMTLDEVIETIAQAETEDKMTVRLHTGDPAIYGALQEQMDLSMTLYRESVPSSGRRRPSGRSIHCPASHRRSSLRATRDGHPYLSVRNCAVSRRIMRPCASFSRLQ